MNNKKKQEGAAENENLKAETVNDVGAEAAADSVSAGVVGKNAETEAPVTEEKGADVSENSEADDIDIVALAQSKMEEYKDTLQRVQAEFDNYRKRNAEAVKQARAANRGCHASPSRKKMRAARKRPARRMSFR